MKVEEWLHQADKSNVSRHYFGMLNFGDPMVAKCMLVVVEWNDREVRDASLLAQCSGVETVQGSL